MGLVVLATTTFAQAKQQTSKTAEKSKTTTTTGQAKQETKQSSSTASSTKMKKDGTPDKRLQRK